MLWSNFSKIDLSGGGGLLSLFPHWDVSKILKMNNFSSASKLLKLIWGSILGGRERSWTWKLIFFSLTHFLGLNIPIRWLVPSLQREILWRHISKNRKATGLFQSVDDNLDFWHPGLWEPPPLPRAMWTTKKTGPDDKLTNAGIHSTLCDR